MAQINDGSSKIGFPSEDIEFEDLNMLFGYLKWRFWDKRNNKHKKGIPQIWIEPIVSCVKAFFPSGSFSLFASSSASTAEQPLAFVGFHASPPQNILCKFFPFPYFLRPIFNLKPDEPCPARKQLFDMTPPPPIQYWTCYPFLGENAEQHTT